MAEEQTEKMASEIPTTNLEAAPAGQEAQPASLGVEDLVNVLRIINVASERGAFKGNELSSVGFINDKIARFVDAAQKAAQEANDGEAANGGE